jgi:hypothetical protein
MPSARDQKMLELMQQAKQKIQNQEVVSEDSPESEQADTDEQTTKEIEALAEKYNYYFQAIGVIYGLLRKNEENKFVVELGGNTYNIYVEKTKYRAFCKHHETNPDQKLFLRVYPKCFIVPRQDPNIYFQVIAWNPENKWEERDGFFILKGIWQFIPQFRAPVLSIYRNKRADDPTGKFKATHLPILMRREGETQPFRFNPKIPKEQLPKKWFVEGLFKFIPSRNCFGWQKDLSDPTERIPKFKKPIKAAPESQEDGDKEGKQKRDNSQENYKVKKVIKLEINAGKKAEEAEKIDAPKKVSEAQKKDEVTPEENNNYSNSLEVISQLLEKGKKQSEIVAILNELGLPTKSGRGKWSNSSVSTVVREMKGQND